ncbi:MAG: hypothetical protein KAH07_05735 [Flavobacteriaceae bacterium]|nr:hypothetical protein [Flavobacteriaceae bacterium]
MKTKIFILIGLFVLSACVKDKKVGGKCEYTDIKENVMVTFIDGELDSNFTISFQPSGIDTDEIYRVTSKQLTGITTNFKIDQLKNKENEYVLLISERTKGSCTPFIIKKIELKQ